MMMIMPYFIKEKLSRCGLWPDCGHCAGLHILLLPHLWVLVSSNNIIVNFKIKCKMRMKTHFVSQMPLEWKHNKTKDNISPKSAAKYPTNIYWVTQELNLHHLRSFNLLLGGVSQSNTSLDRLPRVPGRAWKVLILITWEIETWLQHIQTFLLLTT